MHADDVDLHRIGAEWIERMGWTSDRALATRAAWGDDPRLVTDLEFEDVVVDPVGQVAAVYDAVGLELTADAEAAMRDWLTRRPRETGRPARQFLRTLVHPAHCQKQLRLIGSS
jgi:hypothetical protein